MDFHDDLGFDITSGNLNSFMQDFLLASNLALKMGVINRFATSLGEVNFVPKAVKARVEEERTPDGLSIRVFATAGVSTSVHVTIGFKEELDLEKVIQYIPLVRKVNRVSYDSASSSTTTSLGKSLFHYEDAMLSSSRFMIFKNLFTSILFSANSDGIDRQGATLDTQVSTLGGIPDSQARTWREFYNRTKHVDETPQKISDFVDGMQELPNYMLPVRSVAASILIQALSSLA